MTYEAAIQLLATAGAELAGTRRKFELEHMRVLARALGDPQTQFPSVLIAGTNGKGSTAATLASILACSGYRTGLYTSPHLLRVNERIQISDPAQPGNSLVPIADEAFAESFATVDATSRDLVARGDLPQMPSFFETVTAIAFHAFQHAGVDMAVLEVGLGGRLDATNIVEPVCSVITDIALDHQEWLGNTITEIAREKAGILRPGGTLVTLPQHPEANSAIGERAVALDVTGVNAAAYLPQPSPREAVSDSYVVPAFGGAFTVTPQLPGDHQRRNLALALATAEWLSARTGLDRITAATAERGIREVRWPGRLERTTLPGGATLLMDVAHNPAGVWTLRSYLSRAFADETLPAPRTLVFSGLADKALEEMAQILFPIFDGPGDRVILVPVHSPRAAGAERLATIAAGHAGHEVAMHKQSGDEAVQLLSGIAEAYTSLRSATNGSVVVAGSVYLVAEWKEAMLADSEEQK
ncbi:bifunctional folylpolyglutamate synthase/dihydrofolate synthase [Terriglobus aquaticus]|uniref:Dihydrofolate synthase/folylpolyglutamate synthase n=1 Tax=Terriglobus aquaticus TaxID=940139 RepID=A0ABW9KNH2_9BACT|nr:folylpolyglutamate synthase/dihydrofolate synthase family protein [Terriglobus aquaticus]